MSRIRINIPGESTYDVRVGMNVLDAIDQELVELNTIGQVMIITDTEVAPLYLSSVKQVLTRSGFAVSSVKVPSGEEAKSAVCAHEIWQAMAECGLSRDSVVVALGGGVVGDLAGFCASTYMRGIAVVQVPTTLLSMVDSSVGGKTAINLDAGKNLVGTFFQPMSVCADLSVLDSLPKREWLCGCGEIAKTAVINSEDFFFWLSYHAQDLLDRNPDVVQEAITRCITFKASVVIEDKQETAGVRECLNYGHTLAHAIEAYAGYGVYSHGHAVAQGMRFAARLAAGLGRVDLEFVSLQDQLLDALELYEINLDAPAEDLLAIMKRDKKVRNATLRFVLPLGCGQWEVVELSDDVVLQYVQAWVRSAQ